MTDRRKFPHILIGKSRKFLPILLIGMIYRTCLNIHPLHNQPKKLLEQVKGQIPLRYHQYRTVRIASPQGESGKAGKPLNRRGVSALNINQNISIEQIHLNFLGTRSGLRLMTQLPGVDLADSSVRFNGLELLAWGFNPRWISNAASRWDGI
jgi:hypothetical protein